MSIQTQSSARPAFGALALKCCGQQLPHQILRSAAGFYIGTCDDEGPVSRESMEYFSTHEAAERAHANGAWTQRSNP